MGYIADKECKDNHNLGTCKCTQPSDYFKVFGLDWSVDVWYLFTVKGNYSLMAIYLIIYFKQKTKQRSKLNLTLSVIIFCLCLAKTVGLKLLILRIKLVN